jgi:hypothetical protein
MRTIIASLIVAAIVAGSRAEAQVIGAHALYVPAADARSASRGAQGELGVILSVPYLSLWPSVAIEYQRQEQLGSGRGRVAAELRLLPPNGEGRFHPYVGASVSANRSGGVLSEWAGTVRGLEGMAGVLLIPGERVPVALLLEERFGYVQGREHAKATHLGLLFSFR